MKVEWSDDALADLKRFDTFLQQRFPSLSPVIGQEIVRAALLLERNPRAGRSKPGRREYRTIVLRVLNAAYVLQYRLDKDGVMVLRVFHGRENR